MSQHNEFLALINSHQPLIYKVCMLYADNREDFNDLYQEVVIALWRGQARFRGESKISTWIYRIALNICISDLRVRKRRKIITIPLDSDICIYDDDDKNEQIKELYNLIRQLGKIERMLIMLWLDGNSYEEIAHTMQISKSNVSVKLHRAKEKLKEMSKK